MMRHYIEIFLFTCLSTLPMNAQHRGLVDMSRSKEVVMVNTPMGSVKWTGGFWGDRFRVLSQKSVWEMWDTWNDPDISHGFRNFEVASGFVPGVHQGPPFHDGDMYKWLEACAAIYAVNHDKDLDVLMDKFIEQVAKSQRADGYIHTPVIIEERNKGVDTHAKGNTIIGIEIGKNQKEAFASRLNFETYNLGHLMMAGIVHHRATGKTNLFDCAVKAADFLYNFLKNHRDELARNAICPSHYMAATEMYRETGDKRYLELAEELIDIRDSVRNGEDHNQDRIPFRKQYEAMGHAVRANYLYAGVADLYSEIGEEQLMKNLSSIWDDITNHKIYITGGCGALYDGVSPDGTTYDQPSIQQVHQAYGRQYQLPNEASHNETCAQVGNLLFSWRMLETTNDSRYADMVENELYNGILPGISLDGTKYFYTQALRKNKDFPYELRWPKERQRYISCFCCPPNTLRTLAEAQEYAYTLKDGTLWVNVYGENQLKIKGIAVEQHTSYPNDGQIKLVILDAKKLKQVRLRIPEWCDSATVSINGLPLPTCTSGTYAIVSGPFHKGDTILLNLPMKIRLLESNPLVEETKNQVAIKRGPVVYCLEGCDIGDGKNINNILIPSNISWKEEMQDIAGCKFVALDGQAELSDEAVWKNELYREVSPVCGDVKVRLIPYFAWGNRGNEDMTVWMNLKK